MKIQSLSIVVPNKECINNCEFCVSKMHNDRYPNNLNPAEPNFDLHLNDYIKRLEFARDNGCNTVMLTGTSEPQQNRTFLTYFGMILKIMRNPFRWIEMQTTGAMLDDNYLRFLRNHVGVNMISLSISSLDDETNNKIINPPEKFKVHLADLCWLIKACGFGLRLSLNLTKSFDQFVGCPEQLFKKCNYLNADQVTLRQLYKSGTDSRQDAWIDKNGMALCDFKIIQNYVKNHGKPLGILPHGTIKYSLNSLCVVIDTDCMDKKEKTSEDYKYLILQPDCKLYSQWDDPASLIF